MKRIVRVVRQAFDGISLRAATVAIAAGLAVAGTADAGDAANEKDFDFVTSKIAENYSGWQTKTAGDRRAELDALTRRLRARAADGDDAELRRALEEWVKWFDDGHVQVQWAAATDSPPWTIAPKRITEAAARARLTALGKQRPPVAGLWTIDDRYRLAVLPREGDAATFDAIVLSSKAEGWSAGDVKAVLTTRADGRFDVRYGAGDKTEIALLGTLRAGASVLDTDELGYWRRVYDDPAQTQAAIHRWPGDAFEMKRLDADTMYLRLPSFNDSFTETVETLVAEHAEDLAQARNLIVDIRGNGGGSDFVYDPVLPYLYTQPILRAGVEIRVSADNKRLRDEAADRIATASPEAARTLKEEGERMTTAVTPFIRREPPLEIVRLGRVLPNPARVVVLIDRTGSSGESFLLDARQSRKVVLMGQENSAGVLDFGEMMTMEAPSRRFQLSWATTRSMRLPVDPIDPDGIAPEVSIPADAEDPIAYVVQWLSKQQNMR